MLLLFRYFLHILHTLHRYVSGLSKMNRIPPIVIPVIDKLLSMYFRLCDLSPCTIDLDDQTTLHFWTPNHRKFNKPSLVIIHGYGGTSTWQFFHQVRSLAVGFNLYVPDLLFFGKSWTANSDRSDAFQAKCLVQGMKRLGVDRFAVYGMSYGGFVAYRMAEIHPQEVEKVVIVSSGIVYSENQKENYLGNIGRDISRILVPESPQDLRLLVTLAFFDHCFIKWSPDFMLREFINVMHDANRKGQRELLEYLLKKDANPNIPTLTQETLIIWGDQDKVFPVELAHQMHRSLGSKSRLEIIKNVGHAANIESPNQLNNLINSFVLGD
ncbi:hypothetical protein EZV62_003268 [Acer yangbiense]|uniref:AB hydrolase-1 domain-containing protein n=1 Tax=Acer yangbiense TaxID=1000413 RepID=A0A5C7IGG0_9ROSI|nr:hypothetical protein EZV62_003268 [Acer yangbiense]